MVSLCLGFLRLKSWWLLPPVQTSHGYAPAFPHHTADPDPHLQTLLMAASQLKQLESLRHNLAGNKARWYLRPGVLKQGAKSYTLSWGGVDALAIELVTRSRTRPWPWPKTELSFWLQTGPDSIPRHHFDTASRLSLDSNNRQNLDPHPRLGTDLGYDWTLILVPDCALTLLPDWALILILGWVLTLAVD